MSSPEENILAGIISNRISERKYAEETRENIMALIGAGAEKRFKEKNCARVAELVCKFYQSTQEFLDLDTLSAILKTKNIPQDEAVALQFIYSTAASTEITPKKWRWWLTHSTELDNAIELTDILSNALSIVDGKVTDKDGIAYSGSKDAAIYLLSEVGRVMSTSNILVQPKGNIRAEKLQMLDEVDRAERGEAEIGVFKTGFDFIDKTVRLVKTDFVLVGAYTNEGKSQMCGNFAQRFMVDGRNGIVITAETAREKYRRRIVTRHTHQPGIGVIGGIPYNAIATGEWESETQRELYVRVLDDFCDNQNYGVLDVTQVSAGSTIRDILARCNSFQQEYGVELDYAIVDYLSLLSAIQRRGGRREEIEEILKAFKELCLTFNNGKGILGVAAHQMKQDARESVKAESGKFYTVRDFAETSEAGKSIDLGVVLYRDEEMKKLKELAAGIVKARDSEWSSEVIRLYEDFSTSYIGNLSKAA